LTEATAVLVTGTNRGTGRGIAAAFHALGCRVVSLNRTVTGEDWLGEIPCDLTSMASIDRAVRRLADTVPVLDACVCNAAVRRFAPIAKLRTADWTASVATNLTAPFLLTRATLPLIRRPGGVYVYVGSHAGSRFFEGGAAYCATKAALKALVEVLLLEERPHGVRGVLVSPGAIANHADDDSTEKMSPRSVGDLVAQLVLHCPPDIAVGEVEIRPAVLHPGQSGIARLQQV
jgi:NAD(P)-dependent dehydrogenase (short-subunit alcohol dehydrogenase family)